VIGLIAKERVNELSTIIVYENEECSRNREASVKRDDNIIEIEIVRCKRVEERRELDDVMVD
jgi:hypothetical protein